MKLFFGEIIPDVKIKLPTTKGLREQGKSELKALEGDYKKFQKIGRAHV